MGWKRKKGEIEKGIKERHTRDSLAVNPSYRPLSSPICVDTAQTSGLFTSLSLWVCGFAEFTMLLLRWCPAGVSVSTAGWIWLGLTLTLELSLPVTALSEPDPGFSLCRQSFYRQTPPLGLSVGGGPLLIPLCHRLPGGQSFATLYHPTCDAAVYSAFHLRQGWGERGGKEEGVREDSFISIIW
jgi:hypothetical protein